MKRVSSLIITFYVSTQKEIDNFFKEHDLYAAVSVSTIIPRWAVDVPYWKEKELTDKFLSSDLVKSVHSCVEKFNRK